MRNKRTISYYLEVYGLELDAGKQPHNSHQTQKFWTEEVAF